jgi:hypothetical protein
VEIKGFDSVPQREALELLFMDRNTTNDENVIMAKLKLARGTILGFRMDWAKNGLNPAREEKKISFFLVHIFKLKRNLEKFLDKLLNHEKYIMSIQKILKGLLKIVQNRESK